MGRFYANNARKRGDATDPSALRLVEDDAQRRELEALRERCIAAQRWEHDRAFLDGFRRGDEIAWASLDEFIHRRHAYLREIQARRRGRTGRVGERHMQRYAYLAMWGHLRVVLLVVVALVVGWQALDNGFWIRRDPSQRVWIPSDERQEATNVPQPSPDMAMPLAAPSPLALAVPDIGLPAGDDPARRSEVLADWQRLEARRAASPYRAWSRRLAVAGWSLLLFWLVRRFGRRSRREQPQQVVVRVDLAPE